MIDDQGSHLRIGLRYHVSTTKLEIMASKFILSSIVLLSGTTIFLSSCADDESGSSAPKQSKTTKKHKELERLIFAPPELSLSEAINKYVDPANRSAVNSKVLAEAATLASDRSDNDAAETLATEAIRLDDKNGEAYYQRGRARCNVVAGKDNAAIDDLNKSIALGRGGYNAHLVLARLFDANKQPYKAIEHLTFAMKIAPTTKDLYKARGAIYISVGEKEKALKDYEQLIKLDPRSLASHLVKGQVLESMKRYDEARAAYEKLLTLDEKVVRVPVKALAYKRLAALNSARGEHREAIQNLTDAAKYDVEDDEPIRLRGLEYAKVEDYKKAITDLTEAIEIAPESSSNFEARAEIYAKLGKEDLAEKDRLEAKRLHDVPAERPLYELKEP